MSALNSLSGTVSDIAISGGSGSISDIEGNVYPVVKIGTQIWMASNLKTTKLNDGTEIPLVEDASWITLTSPAYCWFNNDESNANTSGALYNWHTVRTGKLCPTGWHVPSKDEWDALANYLGGEDIAGGKLKEVGTAHWESPNEGATNETGFSALPVGTRDAGTFHDGTTYDHWTNLGTGTIILSSTTGQYGGQWGALLASVHSKLLRFEYGGNPGFSVRCMKY
jgi:uncharacterized protein (TIGR02145 family)